MIFPRAHFNNKSPLSLFSDFLYYLLFSCGWVVVVVSPLKIMLRERNSVLLQIFRNFLCQGSGRRKKIIYSVEMRSLRLQKPNPLLAKIRGKLAVWGSETTRLQKGSSSKKVKRNYYTDFEIDGENHLKYLAYFILRVALPSCSINAAWY